MVLLGFPSLRRSPYGFSLEQGAAGGAPCAGLIIASCGLERVAAGTRAAPEMGEVPSRAGCSRRAQSLRISVGWG
jgi:hypothetical protein